MHTTRLVVRPVTGFIGAEVSGVDLAHVDDETLEEIRAAWLTHLVLFFRDQDLTPGEHVDFARRFGALHIHPFAPNLGPDFPEIIPLDTTNNSAPVDWHSDATFEPEPPMGSILRAIDVPAVGGQTVWASMHAAYDALSATMQELLAGLTAVHDSSFSFGAGGRTGSFSQNTDPAAQRQVAHPVVRTHPVTGRRALFVNQQFTSHIVGTTPDESRAILDFLFVHVQQATFQVRLDWAPHTIAMWDNRCTQHYVTADYRGTGRRFMHRVTVMGDRPV